MLYYIYSVLVVYLLQGILQSSLVLFKPLAFQSLWVRIVSAALTTYTAVGVPTTVYFLISDMQIFADWLGRIIYVLSHLGVSI